MLINQYLLDKISSITNLFTNAFLNIKINKVKDKIPNTTDLGSNRKHVWFASFRDEILGAGRKVDKKTPYFNFFS